jgi:hypothetical protein
MVSRNLDDAAAKKYEMSIRYSDFDVGPGDGFYPPHLSRFVVLRQGEVYESEESISIPTSLFSDPRAKPFPEIGISEGTHLLEIVVGTWPYIADPKPNRKDWKGKGLLWTKSLLSEPMPFTVDKNEPITKCPQD